MLNPVCLNAGNPSPMTGSGNNTYLLRGRAGSAILIDAGVGRPAHLEELARTLETDNLQLDRVLVTHRHSDHASGAGAIAERHPSAQFYKYPVHEDDRRPGVRWQALANADVFETADGPLVALHTPGHAPDHVVFWHPPTRTVFTGDLVVAGSSVVIDVNGGGDLRSYITSLEQVAALEAAVLLPGHGPAITAPETVLRRYLAHRARREAQVISALRQGWDTVPSIAESIYDGLSPALMPAAQQNVRAHLDKLKHEGKASEEDGRWTQI